MQGLPVNVKGVQAAGASASKENDFAGSFY